MPELPEVETIRRGLEPVVTGDTLAKVIVRRHDLRWPIPDDFADRTAGAAVSALRRRSKYLLMDLSTGDTVIIHLGMSGRMVVSGGALGQFHNDVATPDKHDHVTFRLGSGAEIVFNDARRFGSIDLFRTDEAETHWLLKKLGPEPLGNAFNEAYLAEALKGKNTPMKSALLDQRIIAGLGNIYVCEALYRARISPKRKAGQVSAERIHSLVPAIRQTLEDAIAAGGSSLRDYRTSDGELGYFQHAFQVYDREDAPCQTSTCDGVIRRIVQSGRSSFYCPRCQR